MRRENKTNRSILEKSAAFSAEGLIFRERAAILITMICRGGGMADAVDSKSTGFDHAGSSPALGTTFFSPQIPLKRSYPCRMAQNSEKQHFRNKDYNIFTTFFRAVFPSKTVFQSVNGVQAREAAAQNGKSVFPAMFRRENPSPEASRKPLQFPVFF